MTDHRAEAEPHRVGGALHSRARCDDTLALGSDSDQAPAGRGVDPGCGRVRLPRQGAHRAGQAPGLPYAAELQVALGQALQKAEAGYDLGISAAVVLPGYRP